MTTIKHFPRIKICGMTCPEQALYAAQQGVDAIGLILEAQSPRKISLSQAHEIIQKLPPFVSKVALVVNPSAQKVHDIINQLNIDVLQFHGDEDSDFCNQFNFPYMRCLRVKPNDANLIPQMSDIIHQGAQAVLLDA